MLRLFIITLLPCLVFLSGCNSTFQRVIVKHQEMEVPQQDRNIIRTRIIIEEFEDAPARTIINISKDIWYAQEIYRELNIKFIITEIVLAVTNQDWYAYMSKDAAKYPDTLSIYYTHGQPMFLGFVPVDGIGTFPWSKIPHGVFVYGPSIGNNILAHEIGHYLGLHHTFYEDKDGNGDFIEDTLSPEEYEEKMGKMNSYKNYNNLMNYHWNLDNDFITKGQIERIEFFLATSRSNILMKDVGGDPIDIKYPVTDSDKEIKTDD